MPNKDTLTESEKSTTDTSWLKLLELQSWQAELLISGVVIAGLSQLPEIYIQWIEQYVLSSSELGFWFLNIGSMLILAGINSLVFFLCFHFLMRSIWVALLGLNSVYPDGININSTAGAGPKYWKKAKEKYPNLSAYNAELDHTCSLIFSMTAAAIIGISAITLLILFIYLILNLLIGFFPIIEDYLLTIGIVLYFSFLAFTSSLQYLGKKYPDNESVERILERYSNISSNLIGFYFFKKPMGYISGILTSNTSSKKGFLIGLSFSFLLGMYSATQTTSHPIFNNLDPDSYYTFNNKPERIFAFNYEHLNTENKRIFTPVIPADVIYGSVLKVFIPTIEREKEAMNLDETGILQKIRLGRAFRDSIRVENLNKYAAFNQIRVNDIDYDELQFQYYIHPNAQEEGVLVYIPTARFQVGRNVLEIRKNYFSKKEVQKIVKIPFYFEGEG
ncbi:MAG: hypothetical protein AAGI49_00800 [Bacteroidota bacterium]